jgi:hypothetical protein
LKILIPIDKKWDILSNWPEKTLQKGVLSSQILLFVALHVWLMPKIAAPTQSCWKFGD